MKVDINVITNATSKKLDSSKQSNKKDEFKKVLDSHEMQAKSSSNENVDEKYNKDGSLDKANNKELAKSNGKDLEKTNGKDLEKTNNPNLDNINNENQNVSTGKTTIDDSQEMWLVNAEESNKLNSEVLNFIKVSIDALEQSTEKSSKELLGVDKSTDETTQSQQLLQSLIAMFQGFNDTTTIKDQESKSSTVNLEQLVGGEKLITDIKSLLKNNLNEMVALLESSKESSKVPSQIIDVLQKLMTKVEQVEGDLNLLKVPKFETLSVSSEDKSIKDNLLQKLIDQGNKVASEISPNAQMQNSGDSKNDKKSSDNSSFEEKFLNNLIGEDKEEPKISKAINFMNQFESVKTLETSKVQASNLVIDKSNLGTDVIKTIKFMEINNVKDLTVKMNPKELGEITIKIVVESGVMKASISAQNKETYNLLNQNIQDISDKLKSMDIKIQSLDINIYEDSTFFSKDSNEKNNQGHQNRNTGKTVGLEEEDVSLSNNYAMEESQVNKFV
jgi:flagellar hook-length control protein FliK